MKHSCVPWRGRGGDIGHCIHCGEKLMSLGDRVMTPMGEGWLGDLHKYERVDSVTLTDNSYYLYAVRILELDRVLYFSKEDITKIEESV